MIKKKIAILLIAICTTFSMIGCEVKDKENIISGDVSKDIKAEESEVTKSIDEGDKLVKEGKFEEARTAYEKAIAKDKVNKQTYIHIKDKYMENKRFDDAFYIIKMAIENKVDVEKMNKELENIKSNFEVVILDESIKENEEYILPKEVKFNVNDKCLVEPVIWQNTSVPTNQIGSYSYEGTSEKYGRKVKLNLIVVKEKRIGGVVKVYERNGKKYLTFDEVKFIFGFDKAYEEYCKDMRKTGKTPVSIKDFVEPYRIINESRDIVEYEISDDAYIATCRYKVGKDASGPSIELVQISYNQFKNFINNEQYRKATFKVDFKPESCSDDECIYKIATRATLYHIILENNKIVKLEFQYTP